MLFPSARVSAIDDRRGAGVKSFGIVQEGNQSLDGEEK